MMAESKKRERIPLKSGDEYDAFTSWKDVCEFRTGQRARIKRGYRRRLRRVGETALMRAIIEELGGEEDEKDNNDP